MMHPLSLGEAAMHKLKLDLDQLIVESFDTNASGLARRGTVRAFSHVCGPTVIDFTCMNTCGTCDATCSCGGSCGGTCGCTGGYTCGGTCNGTCAEPTCNTCFTNCQQESCVYVCP
jgi:hypothetical protein